jgi:hypothetical protein
MLSHAQRFKASAGFGVKARYFGTFTSSGSVPNQYLRTEF